MVAVARMVWLLLVCDVQVHMHACRACMIFDAAHAVAVAPVTEHLKSLYGAFVVGTPGLAEVHVSVTVLNTLSLPSLYPLLLLAALYLSQSSEYAGMYSTNRQRQPLVDAAMF
jgi:hypothetical protein